jgi:hypothetical protein
MSSVFMNYWFNEFLYNIFHKISFLMVLNYLLLQRQLLEGNIPNRKHFSKRIL